MAEASISCCYFAIEGYSAGFFQQKWVSVISSAQNVSDGVRVPAHTHSPAAPLCLSSMFFHCLQDWMNSLNPEKPKGTGELEGVGGRLIWLCKTERDLLNTLGGL